MHGSADSGKIPSSSISHSAEENSNASAFMYVPVLTSVATSDVPAFWCSCYSLDRLRERCNEAPSTGVTRCRLQQGQEIFFLGDVDTFRNVADEQATCRCNVRSRSFHGEHTEP